jgi:hypothetical protein
VQDPHDAPKAPASHRTAAFILIAMTVTLAYFGWQVYRTSRLSITTISKAGDYRLASTKPAPSTLWLHVSGWLDGEAAIEVPGRGPATLGPGNVEWKIGCDWFQKDCVLKYTPRSATSGRLDVEYRID